MQFACSLEALSILSYYGTEAKEIAWYGALEKARLKGWIWRVVANPASRYLQGTGWLGILVCSYRGLVVRLAGGLWE